MWNADVIDHERDTIGDTEPRHLRGDRARSTELLVRKIGPLTGRRKTIHHGFSKIVDLEVSAWKKVLRHLAGDGALSGTRWSADQDRQRLHRRSGALRLAAHGSTLP